MVRNDFILSRIKNFAIFSVFRNLQKMRRSKKRLQGSSSNELLPSELDKESLQELVDQNSQRLTTEPIENALEIDVRRLYCDGRATKLGYCLHNGCRKPRKLFRVVTKLHKTNSSTDDIRKHFNSHHPLKKDREDLRRRCKKYVTTRLKPLNTFETPEMKDVLTWYDEKNGPAGVSSEEISNTIKYV
jgi:hypothetical protein